MKKIVFDCDNTMGVTRCDVDDGLALLYVMGSAEKLDLLSICTSYGNNTIQAVDINMRLFARRFGLNVPIFKGASRSESPISEASRALVRTVRAFPHEVTIIATGSLTNLLGAWREEPQFFELAERIVVMGGITSSLIFPGKIMDELNLSCDVDAVYQLLLAAQRGAQVAFVTGNSCLDAFFTKDDIHESFAGEDALNTWVRQVCDDWIAHLSHEYKTDGFCCWDVLCPAFVMHSELFREERAKVALNKKLLSVGFLDIVDNKKLTPEGENQVADVTFVYMKDAADVVRHINNTWKKQSSRTRY